MNISSRTPEGTPHRCPICGKSAALEPSYPGGDSTCPSCGNLLWLFRDRLAKAGVPLEQFNVDMLLGDVWRMDSLDVVELVMEIEKASEVTIPDHIAEQLHSVRDILEYIRRQQDEAA